MNKKLIYSGLAFLFTINILKYLFISFIPDFWSGFITGFSIVFSFVFLIIGVVYVSKKSYNKR